MHVGATNIVKNSDAFKWFHTGYGLVFDGTGSWDFGNDHTRNVLIVDIAKSSSSHAENCKNNFLELGKRTTENIMGSVCEPEQNTSIKFSKRNIKFCLSYQS